MLQMPSYRPDPSRQDQLVDQALAVGNLPSDMIRAIRPVSAPQELFPSRLGHSEQWTIQAVLAVARDTPLYRSWRSGMPPQAATLVDDGFSGSTRNSLEVM